MQGIQILPIDEDHIEGYHTCLDLVARERKYLSLVEAPPLENMYSFVRGNVAHFVAVDAGIVVGWCDVIPNKVEGFTHNGRLGMGVLPDYRGRGIGEKLIRSAIAECNHKGLEKLVLTVFASNLPAIKLYEKIGFEVEGVRKKARKIDNQYDDMIEMGLFLDEYTK